MSVINFLTADITADYFYSKLFLAAAVSLVNFVTGETPDLTADFHFKKGYYNHCVKGGVTLAGNA